MSVPAEIVASKQVSLITFRKDGTPVATPVWHVTEGDVLTTVSEAEAWKVKRIRRNPRVEVVACDIRGKVPAGAQPIQGTARLLSPEETLAAHRLLQRRYITSRIGAWFNRTFHVKRPPLMGIEVSF
ncbi:MULTISPECIES: PPOX class F420-dependent oxidoreductase [Actinoplanes]|uniref:Pyridoxamine 5'-phosphate oxidase N-terminal domain-containing protein n=2 Tax=Actinoplanes TaxID=1865 RepID=A0A124G9P9_9ACTN|nr:MULTISPECIES: PPOX class F420-dependent oxidoreductase [Actinoplanes]KUL29605.1 hypothetical protein ADL15_27200 [Actinoplanes awajinensis subsp. mycoplanecinus]GIE71151.1 hypothetical protein Apa02nite_072590 [Actinoplanes palleronii]